MIELDINSLIDGRNQVFIDQIINYGIQPKLFRVVNGFNYWSVDIDIHEKTAIIYAGKKTDDKNGFTHELLHIIEEIHGQFSHKMLPTFIGVSTSSFRCIMTPYMINHINNNILHDRMITQFIASNFKKNKFIFDYYNKPKKISCKKKDYQLTELGKINYNKLEQFLLTYFGYRFHPNSEVKEYYRKAIIRRYQSENIQLVNGLESISTKWENKTITQNNEFFNHLLECLDNWKTNTKYC
jgi:hypothetical protein